jgi:hypothetical protein
MTYRSTFLSRSLLFTLGSLLASLAGGVAGCDDGGEHRGRHRHFDDNSIVFGLDQTRSADGKITTSVGYEMIDVLGHGSRARGVVTADSSCWAENLDDRLGQPHVEGGVAIFRGGLLPAQGVAVIANRPDDLTLDGPAWTNAGDPLTFESKGFVMPDVAPSTITMPSQTLPLTAPVDAAAEVALTAAQDFTVTWAASDAGAPSENVVVSLTALPAGAAGAAGAAANARGTELRCFFDRTAGTGTIPSQLVGRFHDLLGGAPAIKGKLRIATHQQLTIFARGGWTVYVVATAEQRDQSFSLTP